MKEKFIWGGMLILTALFLFIFFIIPYSVQGAVLINEILPNPQGSDRGKEFVELYNDDDSEVLLGDWFIQRVSKKGVVKKYKFKSDDIIKGGAYFVLQTGSLNNDGATITLIDNQNDTVDSREYEVAPEGKSYNRDEKNKKSEWFWGKPTDNEKNIDNPINKKYPRLLLSEIFPNPSGDETVNEFIELYNPNSQDIDLENWQLKDGSKTGKYIFKRKEKIKTHGYFTVHRKDFKFALNNSGGEKVELIAPNGQNIDSVEYKKASEDFSYNYNQKIRQWRWSKFITPGEKNKFNHPPTFKVEVPQHIIAGNQIEFSVYDLVDEDSDNFKVAWDFGDEQAGEGLIIEHKYTDFGEYTISVTVDDGSETISKKTKIQVVRAPLSRLAITKLLPNPEGSDRGNEKITIKNMGKEVVDLSNYKIATGSSSEKLIKHKILQTIKLQPGHSVEIDNKICKFILFNKSGLVQLLMPDNRLIDEVKYKKDAILPGQEYFLDQHNKWQWTREKVTVNNKGVYENNHLPTFKIKKSKKIYKNMYAGFAVHNLKDEDGDRLRVVWDFGDGHKSYLKKTKHKYKKTGRYLVSLTVKDGKEKAVKEFQIKVKKYPKYKLKIVGFMPNPDGKDRGKEFIIIKNESKKKLNFLGYKIATGSTKKRLVGHPFYEEFIIKSGKTKKLFNKTISKFSLLNTKGIIQILYPNGKVADEVKYNKKRILPNEQYVLGDRGQWHWQGGLRIQSKSRGTSKIDVLGVKTSQRYIDITLNSRDKMCNTLQRIRIINWQTKNGADKIKQKILPYPLPKPIHITKQHIHHQTTHSM